MKPNDILINDEVVRATKDVRCIGDDGTQYGIISSKDALNIAYEKDLDLVMVSGGGTPPVVKLMDYDKFRYQNEKKKKEAKKKQKQIDVKEIKLTPKIAQNDINYKVKHAISFLEQGKHVRFKVFLKGREVATPEVCFKLLKTIAQTIEEVGDVEKEPLHEGRNVVMYIVPTKDKSKKEVKANAENENL